MACEIEGCERPINRDGVCFPHKLNTIRFGGLYRLKQTRDITQREMAQDIFDAARESGRDIQQAR